MKLIAYIKNTLDINAKEFMELKHACTDVEWEKFKEDGRTDATASGVELED